MVTKLYEDLEAAVKREARLAESRWNNLISADDIEQEIWLFILENPSSQRFLSTAEPAQVASALRSRADVICSKERIDYDHFTGNFHYTPKEVRELLDTLGEEYDVHSADEKVDLQLGLEELDQYHPEHSNTIEVVYGTPNGYDSKDVSARKRKQEAVDKLTELMNRKRGQRERDRTEGLGTKPKISSISEDDSTDYYKED